jgi:hypothetical protein
MPTRTREEQNALQRERRKRTGNLHTKRYEKTVAGFLVRTYRNMKSRVTGVQRKKHHLYAGVDLLEKADFYQWSQASAEFLRLFAEWEAAGYPRIMTPSIDRIDPSRGYTLDNMHWITFEENSRRGGYWRPSEHGMDARGRPLQRAAA